MMALLSLVSGFLSPYVPDFFKIFQSKIDYAHEENMADKNLAASKISGQFALDTSLAQGDVQDVISARQAAPPSYGTRLLDALDDETGWFARAVKLWLIWALSIIEIANGMVRPWMAYYTFTLYGAVKIARAYLYYKASASGLDWEIVSQSVITMWDDHDWLLMEYVAGFFLGARHRLKSGQ